MYTDDKRKNHYDSTNINRTADEDSEMSSRSNKTVEHKKALIQMDDEPEVIKAKKAHHKTVRIVDSSDNSGFKNKQSLK